MSDGRCSEKGRASSVRASCFIGGWLLPMSSSSLSFEDEEFACARSSDINDDHSAGGSPISFACSQDDDASDFSCRWASDHGSEHGLDASMSSCTFQVSEHAADVSMGSCPFETEETDERGDARKTTMDRSLVNAFRIGTFVVEHLVAIRGEKNLFPGCENGNLLTATLVCVTLFCLSWQTANVARRT